MMEPTLINIVLGLIFGALVTWGLIMVAFLVFLPKILKYINKSVDEAWDEIEEKERKDEEIRRMKQGSGE